MSDHCDQLEQCFQDARCHRGKLYGREAEKALLEQAYQRVRYPHDGTSHVGTKSARHSRTRSELVVIHGASGMGKSALVHSFAAHVVAHGGFVVTVEYTVCRPYGGREQQPHAALVDAWTDFARAVVADNSVSYLRRRLTPTRTRRALWDVVPALFMMEGETDQASAATETTEETPCFSSSETASIELESEIGRTNGLAMVEGDATTQEKDIGCCFRDALGKFMRAVATPEKPFVYLLEDFHLADEYARSVIQSLVEDSSILGTLFVGTCRDDGIYAPHWSAMQSALTESRVSLDCIKLNSLDRSDVVDLMAGVLNVDTDRATSLEALMSNDTRQNVFLIWEYLRELRRQGLLRWDEASRQWNVPDEVDARTMIQSRIRTLSPEYQDYLVLAACLGPILATSILRRLFACDDDALVAFLNEVQSKDLICNDFKRDSWQFSHDKVHEIAYELIPANEREAYHYRIGHKLWKMFDLDEVNRFIFLIVDQLMLGVLLIKDKRETCAVAKLCLCAGVRAVRMSRFKSALGYLEQGIGLLGSDAWTENYDVCLDLYSSSAEVANSLGHVDRVCDLFRAIEQNARGFRDTIRGKATMVHALGSSGKFDEAIQLASEALAKLGEKIPPKASSMRLSFEFAILRRQLRRKSSESLLRLPHMVDEDKLAAMQLLNLLFLYALLGREELVATVAIRMVRLTLNFGLCAVSCVGLSIFAGALCTYEDTKEGARISEVSFSLYERFNTKVWLARLSAIHFYFIHGWIRPLGEAPRQALLYANRVGLLAGDVEVAQACLLVSCFLSSEYGRLPELAIELNDVTEQLELNRQPALVVLTLSMGQLMQNLMGKTNEPLILKGEILDDAGLCLVKAMKVTRDWHHSHLVMLNFLLGDLSVAYEYSKKCRGLVNRLSGPIAVCLVVFICGLVDVADARQSHRRRAPFAKHCSQLLRKAAEGGEFLTFIGKHYLLKAELNALAGKTVDASRCYVLAISTMAQANLKFATAMACERAARFRLEQNDYDRAGSYFRDALHWYKDWGATAKVEHLENEICSYGF